MLSIEPNIFFVDDKENEVKEIINIYRNKGFGVKYFNADPVDGDKIPSLNSYSDAILVFLDLYFTADRILDKEKCAEWVEGIVFKNSFFILVIWSQDTDEAEEVINEIKKTNRIPFVSIIKQKSDYQIGNSKWDFDKLHSDIQGKINERPELKELASWKKSIKNSSNLIIGHLSKDDNPANIPTKLQKIIIGHGGTSLISDNNFEVKQEVLFDALDSVLVSNSKNTRPDVEIAKANKLNLYNTKESPNGDIDSKLNSWFHFKIHPTPIDQSKITPGLICFYDDGDIVKNFSLIDDNKVKEYLKFQIESQSKSNTKLINIALLLTRPCDIAQNKYGKNLKLLSGLKIINPVRKGGDGKKRFDLKTNNTQPDSVKILDHLFFNESENDVTILFDFRYSFSVSKQAFIDKFNKVNTFNKELVSEIQVEYSSYASRLGITQII